LTKNVQNYQTKGNKLNGSGYNGRLWCTVSAERVIRPAFNGGTPHAERYIDEVLNPFFVNLAPAEERVG
jgi:hypothetical protein